jgi:hypothetical protein
VWSVRIANEQHDLTDLVDRTNGADVVWGIDLVGSEAALLRAVLAIAGQIAVYVQGRTVKSVAADFPGEAKTDARDAVVIAKTMQMRRDFLSIAPPT